MVVSLAANMVISKFIIVNMPLIINAEILLCGVLIAMITGIAGGLYPARRAARMKPVEALRRE